MSDGRRVALPLVALLAPWTVVAFPGGIEFVFAWGLVTPAPVHVVTLPDYLFVQTAGLPGRLLAWPIGVLLSVAALASATGGAVLDHEDPRVTAGLLALSGASQLWFAVGLTRGGVVAVPAGTVLAWAIAVDYWPDVRRAGRR